MRSQQHDALRIASSLSRHEQIIQTPSRDVAPSCPHVLGDHDFLGETVLARLFKQATSRTVACQTHRPQHAPCSSIPRISESVESPAPCTPGRMRRLARITPDEEFLKPILKLFHGFTPGLSAVDTMRDCRPGLTSNFMLHLIPYVPQVHISLLIPFVYLAAHIFTFILFSCAFVSLPSRAGPRYILHASVLRSLPPSRLKISLLV